MTNDNNLNNCLCGSDKEDGFDFCKKCFNSLVRICTCNKTFISGVPKYYVLGKINSVITLHTLPDVIPDFFYTQIKGNLYHILGCRGCQHQEEISVKNNFKDALQASIVSCIYQKIENEYEYLSDSLDPDFEEYLDKNGIVVGEPAKIVLNEPTNEPVDEPTS
jgi:hypothetical protein